MKTTIELNTPEELAALHGDGFRLVLADGQEIFVKVASANRRPSAVAEVRREVGEFKCQHAGCDYTSHKEG